MIRKLLYVSVAALLLLLLPGTALAQGSTRNTVSTVNQGAVGIVERSVSFQVRNVNRSLTPCAVDGRRYTVRGHLTGPAAALANPRAVTLFLHGLSYGEFFSRYTAQPGYDFASKQAAAGHVTVTIDRLGYGNSDKPQGDDICFGSRADIAHQIVQQLRAGSYGSNAGHPAFSQVVLAGHSVGSIIAQEEAYSFGDIDGLMVLSYSDTVVSAAAQQALMVATTQCRAGGQRSGGTSGPTGYVYFGAATPAMFLAAHFYAPNANPTVAATTAQLRHRDPCGDILSYKAAVKANLAHVQNIHVPTLVLIGGRDAIYPTAAGTQARLLTGSRSVTAVNLAATGHAVTLHLSRNTFLAQVSQWLNGHGFGSGAAVAMPIGGVAAGGGGTARQEPGRSALPLGAGVLAVVLLGFGGWTFRRAAHTPRG